MGRLTRVLSQVSGDMDKSVLEVILTRRKKYTTQEINYGYTPKVHQNSRTTKHSRELKGLEWHWHTYGFTKSEMNPYAWTKEQMVDGPQGYPGELTSAGRMCYGHQTKQWKHIGEIDFDWTQHVGPAHLYAACRPHAPPPLSQRVDPRAQLLLARAAQAAQPHARGPQG